MILIATIDVTVLLSQEIPRRSQLKIGLDDDDEKERSCIGQTDAEVLLKRVRG